MLSPASAAPPLTPLLSASSSRDGCKRLPLGDRAEWLERVAVLSTVVNVDSPCLAHDCETLSGFLHSANLRILIGIPARPLPRTDGETGRGEGEDF